MPKLKSTILKNSISGHKWLGWVGGLALLIFGLSALLHPLMTWTGPKAASFYPPRAVMKAEYAGAIPRILAQNNITAALMVKIVPAENGALLQVTEHNDQPRRYFDLDSGLERADYDQSHALWLARYYTGLTDAGVKDIHFQNEFDHAYPWVNRLLPVYRITFDTDDNRTAFIYTELGALGNLTNDRKTAMQTVFRLLHTWSWLDNLPYARPLIMLVFLLSLFGLALTGMAMVFLLKHRKIPDQKRRWHRLISYLVWIPLLGFTASGTYHLLQYAYGGETQRGLKLGAPISISAENFGTNSDWLSPYQNTKLNAISLVQSPDGNLLYRLGIPQGKAGQKVTRAERFDGTPIEKTALYFDAKTGEEASVSDKDMAFAYAEKYMGLPADKIIHSELVTRFGPDYDFRNKRLPVWRVDYASDNDDILFIDPASGILVDRAINTERLESLSFSFLHKWNFLTPMIGRMARDILIVVILCFALGGTVFGYTMLLKQRKKRG